MGTKTGSGKKITVFALCNTLFFGVIIFIMLFPYINIIAKSLSGAVAVNAGVVFLAPKDFTLDVYKYVLGESGLMRSFFVSLFVTVTGTVTALAVTVLMAYPLSKPSLRGRKIVLYIVIFSMLFYGGIVPSYFIMKQYKLINTVFALIVPTVFVPFNMLIMKTFFEGIPESMEESARIDGANIPRILVSIVLPVSLPVLATVSLFYAVGYWNAYFHPSLFVSSQKLRTLQVFLYSLMSSTADTGELISMSQNPNISIGNTQAAAIMISTVPMIILYPFLQKYFVHGMTVGSVKG
jgi:putative aldouronate transport system permease protein